MKQKKHGVSLAMLGVVLMTFAACEGNRAATSGTSAYTSPSASGATAAGTVPSGAAPSGAASTVFALRTKRLDGTPVSLADWSGKVLLVVNTASECGYTPQYAGLQKLHETYGSRGFAVLGFPSNDFGGQEPGASTEIATFCKKNYGVTFPMFEKVATKGAAKSDLYALLGGALGEPKWNFHKYIVDKHGVPAKAFPSAVKPDAPELTSAIEAALAAP